VITITPEDVEVNLVCDACGNELDAKQRARFPSDVEVVPCLHCIEAEFERGCAKGREEANQQEGGE